MNPTFSAKEFDLLVLAQSIATDKDTSVEMVLESLLTRLTEDDESIFGYAFSDQVDRDLDLEPTAA